MAWRAAGVVCTSAPGPIPTIERTPFPSGVSGDLAVSSAMGASRGGRDRTGWEWNPRDGKGHRPTGAGLGIDLFFDQQSLGARGLERCRLCDAAGADVPLDNLGWARDPGRPVQFLGVEEQERPTVALSELEDRGLVTLLFDAGDTLDRLR